MVATIVIIVVVVLVLVTLWRTIRIVPQARARVIERFGRYNRTLPRGSRLSSHSSTGCGRWSTSASRSCPSRRSR